MRLDAYVIDICDLKLHFREIIIIVRLWLIKLNLSEHYLSAIMYVTDFN
jgi:hypothetical protein